MPSLLAVAFFFFIYFGLFFIAVQMLKKTVDLDRGYSAMQWCLFKASFKLFVYDLKIK